MTRIHPQTLSNIIRRLREVPRRRRGVVHETLRDAPVGSGPFLVVVAKDGGSAGDDESTCSFTYTVKDARSLAELATNVQPERGRIPFIEYVEAGLVDTEGTEYEYEYGSGGTVYATSPYGLADYDNEGNLLLLEAYGETPAEPTPCDEEPE